MLSAAQMAVQECDCGTGCVSLIWSIARITITRFGVEWEKKSVMSLKICKESVGIIIPEVSETCLQCVTKLLRNSPLLIIQSGAFLLPSVAISPIS
jgi:hypothetical protein